MTSLLECMHAQGCYWSVTAVSMVTMKQLAEREIYSKFTHGILSPSLPRFLEDRYTASPLEVQVCKLGVVWCRQCTKTKTVKISAGGSTDKSAKIIPIAPIKYPTIW